MQPAKAKQQLLYTIHNYSEKCLDYYEKIFALASDAALSKVCLGIFKKRAENPNDSNFTKILEYLGRIWFSSEMEISTAESQLVSRFLLARQVIKFSFILR